MEYFCIECDRSVDPYTVGDGGEGFCATCLEMVAVYEKGDYDEDEEDDE